MLRWARNKHELCPEIKRIAERLLERALFRKTQVRTSALNRNIKNPGQSEVFRGTTGAAKESINSSVEIATPLSWSPGRTGLRDRNKPLVLVSAFRFRLKRSKRNQRQT
jgi:hypothetical protein